MALVEDGIINNIPNVLLISSSEEKHGLGISIRRAEQPFSGRVFADTFEDRADSAR